MGFFMFVFRIVHNKRHLFAGRIGVLKKKNGFSRVYRVRDDNRNTVVFYNSSGYTAFL